MNMRKDRPKNEIAIFSKEWIILFVLQTTIPSKMKKVLLLVSLQNSTFLSLSQELKVIPLWFY